MADNSSFIPNLSSASLEIITKFSNKMAENEILTRKKELIKHEIRRIRTNVSLALNAYHAYKKDDKDPRETQIELYDVLEDLGYCYTELCHELYKLVGKRTYIEFYNYPATIEEAHEICDENGTWEKKY